MAASNSLPDELELLSSIAEGNERAFKKVYYAYYNRIFSFSLGMLQSRMLAEEVVQESMIKIWQMGDELKTIKNLDAYLKTIARNLTLNLLKRKELERKANKALSAGSTELHNETEESILLNESRKILEEGIDMLPTQQRLVYKLCQQEGLKYEEAAKQLNISHGSVQTHMKLALKFLRNHIRQNTDLAILAVIFKLF